MAKYISWILALLLLSCNADKVSDKPVEKGFECSYQELNSINNSETSKNGNTANGSVEFTIKSNLEKLGKIELGINASDTLDVERVDKILKASTSYSTEFFERHNSIVQILCDIEKDLKDTTLSLSSRELLFKEKIEKRTQYFDFILERGLSIEEKIGKKRNKNEKKDTVEKERDVKIENKGNLSMYQSGGVVNQTTIASPKEQFPEKEKLEIVKNINLKYKEIGQEGWTCVAVTANKNNPKSFELSEDLKSFLKEKGYKLVEGSSTIMSDGWEKVRFFVQKGYCMEIIITY